MTTNPKRTQTKYICTLHTQMYPKLVPAQSRFTLLFVVLLHTTIEDMIFFRRIKTGRQPDNHM